MITLFSVFLFLNIYEKFFREIFLVSYRTTNNVAAIANTRAIVKATVQLREKCCNSTNDLISISSTFLTTSTLTLAKDRKHNCVYTLHVKIRTGLIDQDEFNNYYIIQKFYLFKLNT